MTSPLRPAGNPRSRSRGFLDRPIAETQPTLSITKFLAVIIFVISVGIVPAWFMSWVVDDQASAIEQQQAIEIMGAIWLGSLSVGTVGAAAARFVRREHVPGDRPTKGRHAGGSTITWGTLLGLIVPAGLLIPALVPNLFGYDSRLVLGVAGCGGLLPATLEAFPGAVRQWRMRGGAPPAE